MTTVAVLGVALGLLFNRGPGLVSAQPSYGTPLGGTFGPVGADVTALAMGTYQGKPVVAYADGTTRAIELWDPAAGTRIAALPGMARSDVLSMTMSTAGGKPTLYWSAADGYVRRWELGASGPGPWNKACDRDARIAAGANETLLIGCGDGMVKSADPRVVAGVKPAAATYVRGAVTALAWDPEGGRTIVGTKLGYVGVGERGFVVKGPVQAVATAGAGQVAVTAAGSTAVYSVATGKPIRTISNQVSGSAVVRTGGDDMIATAADGLNVWSTHESRWLGLLSADKQKVTALAGDSGALVAAVGGRLRAWRLDGYR
ncbi:MAG: hypothetical protein HOY71_56760 [Nonomuraea sp.]|nr:hypothetical protein [Nonomuraea sp.]